MKKIMAVVISLLCISPILATEGTIIAGETVDVPLSVIDEGASATLGGLTSKINNVFRRWVKMGGVDVWFYETSDEIQTYDLFLLPDGQNEPGDWGALVDEGIFETSEAVTLFDCVDCVFETHEFSYDSITTIEDVTKGEGTEDYKEFTNSADQPTCYDAKDNLKRLGVSWATAPPLKVFHVSDAFGEIGGDICL